MDKGLFSLKPRGADCCVSQGPGAHWSEPAPPPSTLSHGWCFDGKGSILNGSGPFQAPVIIWDTTFGVCCQGVSLGTLVCSPPPPPPQPPRTPMGRGFHPTFKHFKLSNRITVGLKYTRWSSLKGQERAIFSQMNTGTASKAVLGKPLRDRVEQVLWVFPSAYRHHLDLNWTKTYFCQFVSNRASQQAATIGNRHRLASCFTVHRACDTEMMCFKYSLPYEPKQDLEWLAEVAWSRKCNVGCSGGGSGGGSSGTTWRLGYKEAILLHNWQPWSCVLGAEKQQSPRKTQQSQRKTAVPNKENETRKPVVRVQVFLPCAEWNPTLWN